LGNSKTTKTASTTASTTYGSTTSFIDLTSIGLGTGANLRTGNEINLHHLDINMLFVIADTSNFVRIIIFQWFPSDSSDAPQANEIYNSTYSSGNNEHFALLNPLKPSRFKVYKDFTIKLDAAHVIEHRQMRINCKHKCAFEVGVSTGRNHMYMAIVSDSTVGAHPTVALNWNVEFDE